MVSLSITWRYNWLHNGKWEFNFGEKNVGPEFTNELIYDFISQGGINDMSIVNKIVSDDTILYWRNLSSISRWF